jgi:hypothetical protein
MSACASTSARLCFEAAKGSTSALGAIDVREFTDVDVQMGAT